MYTRVLVIILFFSTSFGLLAQPKVDSLRTLIENAKGSGDTKLLSNHYAQLGYFYIHQGRYDSSISYYQKSLALEKFIPNIDLLASSLNAIGTAYSSLGRYDSSIHYYQQALTVYTTVRDTLHAAMIETNLSILFKNLGVYDKALEYGFKAIKRHEQLNEWQSLGSSYNTVSLVYLKVRDYPNALLYGYRALATRKKINHQKGIGLSYNNIGEIYLVMGSYDSALTNLRKALLVKQQSNDRKSFSTTLTNTGTALYRLGKIGEAERFFSESLNYKHEFKDRVGEAVCYNNLARIALERQDHRKAEVLLMKAAVILDESESPEVRRENVELKIRMYETTNRFPMAVDHMRQLIAIKDSLLSQEKAESMMAFQIRYETEKKEQKILLLEKQGLVNTAELKTKQSMIYGLSAGLMLVFIIAGLVYNNFRIAKKGKAMQELLNRELNHRVKNNLQLLASVLSLQSQELTDEHAVIAVKGNESRVNAMALIHRKLYLRENSRTILFRDYVQELVDYLLYAYSYRKDEIEVRLDIGEIDLDVEKAIPIGLVLNEVVSNTLKYAFQLQKSPVIEIQARVNSLNELLLRIVDNGSGFVPEIARDSDQSFGLKMISLLTKELKGGIRIQSEAGTAVHIKIPLK